MAQSTDGVARQQQIELLLARQDFTKVATDLWLTDSRLSAARNEVDEVQEELEKISASCSELPPWLASTCKRHVLEAETRASELETDKETRERELQMSTSVLRDLLSELPKEALLLQFSESRHSPYPDGEDKKPSDQSGILRKGSLQLANLKPTLHVTDSVVENDELNALRQDLQASKDKAMQVESELAELRRQHEALIEESNKRASEEENQSNKSDLKEDRDFSSLGFDELQQEAVEIFSMVSMLITIPGDTEATRVMTKETLIALYGHPVPGTKLWKALDPSGSGT